jgi:hypothetical protein
VARATKTPARRIGARGLVVFYVTSIVGAGILVVPGIAARRAGPSSLAAWLVLALASFPIALMFAEMSARRPDCGGIAALLRDVLGTSAGDTASLLLVVAYVLIVPVMAIASARHLCNVLSLGTGLVKPLAVGFVLISAGFCLASVATAASLQAIVLITLLASLLATIAVAACAHGVAELRISVRRSTPGPFLAAVRRVERLPAAGERRGGRSSKAAVWEASTVTASPAERSHQSARSSRCPFWRVGLVGAEADVQHLAATCPGGQQRVIPRLLLMGGTGLEPVTSCL